MVQEAGGKEGGGDLPGELRHHQHRPPAGQLAALDDVGVEMIPAVEDLTPRPQQAGQLAGPASTEDSSGWDLVQWRGRTEGPRAVCGAH